MLIKAQCLPDVIERRPLGMALSGFLRVCSSDTPFQQRARGADDCAVLARRPLTGVD